MKTFSETAHNISNIQNPRNIYIYLLMVHYYNLIEDVLMITG